MSDDPAPCSNCSKEKHQFETSANASRANWIINLAKAPFIKTGEISDEIHSSKFIKEICANPGCDEGQELLKKKLKIINQDFEDGWDQLDKSDIKLLEQFSEGALDLVDENGIEWENGEKRRQWAEIEDTIDDLDHEFTEQATEDMALWEVENAPNPGIDEIPPIANALGNLHETRIEIKQATIQERIDEIGTYEKWEENEGASYSEAITASLEQTKEDIEELNEIRDKLGTYRDKEEFEPLRKLSQSDGSKSWQEQEEELDTEYDQLHQLKQIEEQRQSNVDAEWYDEQIENRKSLIKERMPTDVGESSNESEGVREENETTEKEEDKQDQSDELQQVEQENQRLEKALQQERDKNQELSDSLQAARDKYATLQEKFQTLRDDRRQRGTEHERDTDPTAANDRAPETDTSDPQNESGDRSTNSPVSKATTKLRGGLAKPAGAARKAAKKLRGRFSGPPDKPYPAQHATNINRTNTTTESETSANSQSSKDETLVESLQTERSQTDRSNGRERASSRDSKQDGPDRGRF